MAVDAITELITVGCYLSGMLVGAKFHSHTFPKISLFGVFLMFFGVVIKVLPVCFLGCFLSCLFVGPFLMGVVEEIWGSWHYVRDFGILIGCLLGIMVLAPYVGLQKMASKLRKTLFLL